MSEIIERVVKSRLIDHVTYNQVLNPHQSAYCKRHSTETALLYIHDHLVNAIGSQKVSCLCLLDLSAAFDTIDHNILITRLSSWFGIHGSVLSWFKSYLSSRSFCVKYDNNLSSFHTPVKVFPRLCSWPSTLHHIHYAPPYSELFFFPWPPPLCRCGRWAASTAVIISLTSVLFIGFMPDFVTSFEVTISRSNQ